MTKKTEQIMKEHYWKNNEMNIFSLTDTDCKKEIMKILKELTKAINRNVEYCKKKPESWAKKNQKTHLLKQKLC